MVNIYLSYVDGVWFPSNLVHVISACWRYLCSSPLSSSSRSPFIISLPLFPSALQSNKKRAESVGVDRCFTHAAAQLTGRRDEEKEGEEDRGRQKERRWDGVRKSEGERRKSERERERVGGKRGVLCLQLLGWLRGWRTEQNVLYVCLCAFTCVYFCTHVVCCSLHTAECAQELPNAFARSYVKKRSHAGRRGALFPERDGGSIDLNTKSMFHTEEMSLVSPVICSNSSTSSQLTRERFNDSREYNCKNVMNYI